MKNLETVKENAWNIEEIAPEGLGYGSGNISGLVRIETLEGNTRMSHDLITEIVQDEKLLQEVNSVDDGCSDGRHADSFLMQSSNSSSQTIPSRQKLFGGGATMVMASLLGNASMLDETDNLNGIYKKSMDMLDENGIEFGGHTALGTESSKSGCGAIDFAPEIISNIYQERTLLKKSIESLMDPSVNEDYLDFVIEDIATNCAKFSKDFSNTSFNRREVLNDYIDRKKVVAELDGAHQEAFIVVNIDIDNMTLNQQRVRDVSGGIIQAFAMDIPRAKFICDKLYAEPDAKKIGLIAMLLYSFSTASILTKGDLPVFSVYEKNNKVDLDFSA